MDSYVKWIAIGLCLLTSVGCAGLQLGDNATETEKAVAMCQDAQFGYNLSVVMLEQAMISTEAQAYWAAYKSGAALAIATYCTQEGAL